MMLRSIDLKLREKLKDREFRIEWFRAQLAASVPDLFRNLREERSLTQQQLATEADMKQSAISRFEQSDEAIWKFETLLKMAEALDAQLVISLVKAEDVISRYERSETAGRSKASVLDAANETKKFSDEYLRPTRQSLHDVMANESKRRASVQRRQSASAMNEEGRHAWN